MEGVKRDEVAASLRYGGGMARRNRYLIATMPDGYVKTIGPTSQPFTHYWRIVADLGGGRTEVFWGHAKSRKAAMANDAAMAEAVRQRGWVGYRFEVVELVEADGPPETMTKSSHGRGGGRAKALRMGVILPSCTPFE